MGKYLHAQKQNAHHILHLDIERDDLLFIVTTLLLQGVDSRERQDNDYFPVTTYEFSS